ncbi:MAG: peroxiredoxin Q/BCP [Chloroflexi bacterium]|nr:MAG: peroxiredoxin Q/BCP [Chloroflexota bacterium]MBA4376694.1 thioredoxin-dependent thiol peroxidase [Anaerolinea sp.]
MLNENSFAPDFTIFDETGKARSLSEFKGQEVVLYFYPKDDTPGCTTEACNFRDDFSEYEKAGVVILGVSPDSPKSHAKFKEKHLLPFTLLADEDHKVCELFGVWGKKSMYGREYEGVLRTTFLISKEGMIKKAFENVKPAGHSKDILALL